MTNPKKHYCHKSVQNLSGQIAGMSDHSLKSYYLPALTDERRERADWRLARRVAIREALRRGLIDSDPCDAP